MADNIETLYCIAASSGIIIEQNWERLQVLMGLGTLAACLPAWKLLVAEADTHDFIRLKYRKDVFESRPKALYVTSADLRA